MELHQFISMSFLLLVRHTNFVPEWYFCLLNQWYKWTYISTLYDIVDNVNIFTNAMNAAQLVGALNKKVTVQVYDMAKFVGDHFEKVIQMTSDHHFTFYTMQLDTVSLKRFCDSRTISFRILRDTLWILQQINFLHPLSH